MNLQSDSFTAPTEPAMTPTGPRRAAVVFVFITVTLDMLAIGLIIPVLPRLILSFLDGKTADCMVKVTDAQHRS